MRIVVGVSGGIAAYKACEVVSRLVKLGHDVRVVMTPAAAQFVAPLTFRALSGHEVGMHTNDEPEGPISHVILSHWAEALVIAPASASLMARLAHGQAVDLLSLVYLGFHGPILLAPAMEPEMWAHPRTKANSDVLRQDGVHVIGPNSGRLASGFAGVGRMAEPEEIVEMVADLLSPHDLLGLRLLVTAGSTWEYFDPVRLLSNPSTGLMGTLIANLAAQRGAEVTLVRGPGVRERIHRDVVSRTVVSAVDMLQAVSELMVEADVLVGAAAVSDFRPRQTLPRKAHKDDVGLVWEMERNPDIIATMGTHYAGKKLLVGFAAETENPVQQAMNKRTKKHLDAVVANLVGHGQGFGESPHEAWIVTREDVIHVTQGHKEATARALLDWIQSQRRGA